MRSRAVFLWLLLPPLALLLAALAVLLLRHEPAWYAAAAAPPGPDRVRGSERFTRGFLDMLGGIRNGGEWGGDFSAADANAYLEEGFLDSGLAARVLPDGISQPRVAVDGDRIRLGFRYGGAWGTVVTIEFRPWLAPQEPNVLCLELQSFRVGALPLSVQSILESISEAGRRSGVDVNWYRNPDTGRPVAVLRFQADKPRPTLELSSLYLGPGTLTLRGRSAETVPATPPPASAAPQAAPKSAPTAPVPSPPASAPPPGPKPRPN